MFKNSSGVANQIQTMGRVRRMCNRATVTEMVGPKPICVGKNSLQRSSGGSTRLTNYALALIVFRIFHRSRHQLFSSSFSHLISFFASTTLPRKAMRSIVKSLRLYFMTDQ